MSNAKLSFATAIAISVIAAASGCKKGPPEGPARGKSLYANCVACHGQSGEGNADYGAPAIAGQYEWYLRRQLSNFRTGVRGAHPDDAEGLRMRPMVKVLRSDEDVAAVAAYVASLKPVNPAATVKGDAQKGKTFYATCIACHGDKGVGNPAQAAPSLVNLQDWYVVRQIQKFKGGLRGGNTQRDATGSTMRGMAMTLATDEAIADVAAFINSL